MHLRRLQNRLEGDAHEARGYGFGPALPFGDGQGRQRIRRSGRAALFAPITAMSTSATLGRCSDRIQSVFRTTQNAYWKQDLQIAGFDRVRELSYRGNGAEYIPRRYCIARGHFSDDSVHTVIYDIEEAAGHHRHRRRRRMVRRRARPAVRVLAGVQLAAALRRAMPRLGGAGREILMPPARRPSCGGALACRGGDGALARPDARPISSPPPRSIITC